jgi:putative zincin peptidase
MRAAEWRPGTRTAAILGLAAIAVFILGMILYALPVAFRTGGRAIRVAIGPLDLLLALGLAAGLFVLHEALHGLAMRRVGAHPRFGVTMVGKVLPALYATAPAYRFRRPPFLLVAAAPAVLISALGFLACASPWGGYLVLPFAAHLSGCVGDAAMIWQVVRQPPGTEYEDLVDGVRFHRPHAGDPSLPR